MLPEKLLQVLGHEGVVSVATVGSEGPHLVNTWNSYIQITEDEHLLIPVGGMNKTEKNVTEDNHVLITLGSREVEGYHGHGTGFLIRGIADFSTVGADFQAVKVRFPWARAALTISINDIMQTL